MALEVVIAVVGALLLVITYWMFWAGLAGTAGLVQLRRCHTCGHLVPSAKGPVTGCAYCRHQRISRHLARHRLRHYLPGEW